MFKALILSAAALLSTAAAAGPVNVNTADAQPLAAELNGVGPVIAQRIVAHREANGPYSEPTQLTQVRGVGSKTLEKNAEFILLK